jgi:hypothetical protein
VLDGDRKAINAGYGGNWTDGTANTFPDIVTTGFPQKYTINKVIVYSLQDNYGNPVDPESVPGSGPVTFTQYGLIDFVVEGWNGDQWVQLQSVTGNNLVMRPVSFAPFTTDRVRVRITRSAYSNSSMTELEVWGVQPAGGADVNVALAKFGSVAYASSTLGNAYPVSSIIDGDRADLMPGNGGNWTNATQHSYQPYPDWVEVDFPTNRTLDSVVLYSLQDQYNTPVEPGSSMTFTQYGMTNFDVQAWNSSTGSWYSVGTPISGNNLVRRTVTLSTPVTTTRIRVNTTGSPDGYSHVVEVEAWGH